MTDIAPTVDAHRSSAQTSADASRPSTRWRTDFEFHAGRHAVVDPTDAAELPELARRILGQSLATFQVGESGTGEHLLAAAAIAPTDADYRAALAQFVAEEQEHARLLALTLGHLGHPLRTSHWTDRVFMLLRRSRSLRTEVLILLVAEVIALRYYSALRDRNLSPGLTDLFARIHEDELRHVKFHAETLPPHLDRFRPTTRWMVRTVWAGVVTGASLIVAWDHGRTLALAGIRRTEFVRDVWRLRRDLSVRLFD